MGWRRFRHHRVRHLLYAGRPAWGLLPTIPTPKHKVPESHIRERSQRRSESSGVLIIVRPTTTLLSGSEASCRGASQGLVAAVIRKIRNLLDVVRMTVSADYAHQISSEYWKNQTESLEELTDEQRATYFDNLLAVLDPEPDDSILDYGCGAGEKSEFLLNKGYQVTGGDISESLMTVARARGVECDTIDDILASGRQFDRVFMHGTFMYVHPRRRADFLRRARPLLNPGGRLFLLGEPDIEKRMHGSRHPVQVKLATVLPVYQFFNASFWTKPDKLEATALASGYVTLEYRKGPPTISAPDRSHFILGTAS